MLASLIGTCVAARMKSKPVHYEFTLYNTYKKNYRVGKFLPFEGAATLYTKIDKQLAGLMAKAPDLYPSQKSVVVAMNAMIDKKKLMKDGEPYRVAPKYDYLKRPVEEKLGYEINPRNPVTFEDWRKAAEAFLKEVESIK